MSGGSNPSGGELIVYGEGTRFGSRFSSAAKASTVHLARVCGLSSVCGGYAG